jgi:hypothetical protein
VKPLRVGCTGSRCFGLRGSGLQFRGWWLGVGGSGSPVSGLMVRVRVSSFGVRGSGFWSRVAGRGSQVSGLRFVGFTFWASDSVTCPGPRAAHLPYLRDVETRQLRIVTAQSLVQGHAPHICRISRVKGLGFGVWGFGVKAQLAYKDPSKVNVSMGLGFRV